MCCSALEGGRDIRVRRVDGERKVARPLLLVVDDAGKSAVESRRAMAPTFSTPRRRAAGA